MATQSPSRQNQTRQSFGQKTPKLSTNSFNSNGSTVLDRLETRFKESHDPIQTLSSDEEDLSDDGTIVVNESESESNSEELEEEEEEGDEEEEEGDEEQCMEPDTTTNSTALLEKEIREERDAKPISTTHNKNISEPTTSLKENQQTSSIASIVEQNEYSDESSEEEEEEEEEEEQRQLTGERDSMKEDYQTKLMDEGINFEEEEEEGYRHTNPLVTDTRSSKDIVMQEDSNEIEKQDSSQEEDVEMQSNDDSEDIVDTPVMMEQVGEDSGSESSVDEEDNENVTDIQIPSLEESERLQEQQDQDSSQNCELMSRSPIRLHSSERTNSHNPIDKEDESFLHTDTTHSKDGKKAKVKSVVSDHSSSCKQNDAKKKKKQQNLQRTEHSSSELSRGSKSSKQNRIKNTPPGEKEEKVAEKPNRTNLSKIPSKSDKTASSTVNSSKDNNSKRASSSNSKQSKTVDRCVKSKKPKSSSFVPRNTSTKEDQSFSESENGLQVENELEQYVIEQQTVNKDNYIQLQNFFEKRRPKNLNQYNIFNQNWPTIERSLSRQNISIDKKELWPRIKTQYPKIHEFINKKFEKNKKKIETFEATYPIYKEYVTYKRELARKRKEARKNPQENLPTKQPTNSSKTSSDTANQRKAPRSSTKPTGVTKSSDEHVKKKSSSSSRNQKKKSMRPESSDRLASSNAVSHSPTNSKSPRDSGSKKNHNKRPQTTVESSLPSHLSKRESHTLTDEQFETKLEHLRSEAKRYKNTLNGTEQAKTLIEGLYSISTREFETADRPLVASTVDLFSQYSDIYHFSIVGMKRSIDTILEAAATVQEDEEEHGYYSEESVDNHSEMQTSYSSSEEEDNVNERQIHHQGPSSPPSKSVQKRKKIPQEDSHKLKKRPIQKATSTPHSKRKKLS